MVELTSEHKEVLSKFVKSYKNWLKTEEGQKNLEDHRKHSSFFKSELSEENIEKLTEEKFVEIYKKLWASNIWGNKDWYVQNKLLLPNGLDKIKTELKKLLYGDEKIDTRFSDFNNNVKGFGPSSISEILHFVFPDKYCLWNDKPKTVLPYLQIDILPDRFFKYNITSGKDYLECVKALALLKDYLKEKGFENPNFIDVDCVLWYVYNQIELKPKKEKEEKPKKRSEIKISTHEEAEYYLLKLGKVLDYYTYTADAAKKFNETELGEIAILKNIPDFTGERDKNSARLIDVIWFDDAENPRFCFEVEHSTTITKGLNRLIQLEQFYVTFVIVAPEDKRSKFVTEMAKYPYRRIRDRFKFISYEDLIQLYENALKFIKLRDSLLM